MKAYRYVFYKLFTWFRKSDVAEYKAPAGVYLLLTINLLTVHQIIGIIVGKKIFLPDLQRNTLFAVGIRHLLVHHFLLVFNNRYIHSIKEGEHEHERQGEKASLFAFLYIIGTIIIVRTSLYAERHVFG